MNPEKDCSTGLANFTGLLCSECDHWERQDEADPYSKGYCTIFDKLTGWTHGDKCTAHSKLNCGESPRSPSVTYVRCENCKITIGSAWAGGPCPGCDHPIPALED